MGKKLMAMIFYLSVVVFVFNSCVFANSGEVMWTADGVPISTEAGNQYYPQLISDGTSGAIITWRDYRNGNGDIYAQRVDANGNAQWTVNGVAICTATNTQNYPQLISDGSGGAIITWDDYRGGTYYDVYAQRVDANGNVQWMTNGVAICTVRNTYHEAYPQLISDGSGGAIITWWDSRNGNQNIYAQRVDTNGNVQWTSNGVAICTVASSQYGPRPISDGSGGAIITWNDYRGGATADIYAQRINSSGTVQWTTDGVAICTAANTQYNQKLISDGTGGAIITWDDKRGGTYFDTYSQRVDANGTVQWTTDGVAICTVRNSDYAAAPQLISDGSGGAIITWWDSRNGNRDIYAQRVDTNGNVQWTSNGIAICAVASSQQDDPQLISDGSGGAIITWRDYRNGNGDIYAQRVDANGTAQWTADGVAICTAASYSCGDPQLISDGSGGAIITWQDNRGSTSYDPYAIYSQRVEGLRTWYLAEGCTNGFDAWILIQNPNTGNADVTITYMDQDGNTVQESMTVQGERRYTRKINDVTNMNNKGGVSTKIESTNGVGVIVERAMYWNADGISWVGGHNGLGVTSPATTWYLAEGCTNGFDTYVLIQNPNTSTANITLTYMDQDGNTVQESTTVQGQRRYTRKINEVTDMNNKSGVSTKIESTNEVGIIAERAMYWYDSTRSYWQGGHDTVGVTSPSTIWYLAEGCTNGFDTFVLIQNPNTSDANVTLTYMDQDGNTVEESTTVQGERRYTRKINDVTDMNNKSGVSTKIESTNGVGIIAERAMYWNAGGISWKGGHCSTGVTSPATTWYLAEGCTNGFDTFVLIQNPNTSTANITLTYMDQDGNTVQESTTVQGQRRYTRKINDVTDMNNKGGVSTKIESTNGVGVIVERAMYWNSGGIEWVEGHCSHGVVY